MLKYSHCTFKDCGYTYPNNQKQSQRWHNSKPHLALPHPQNQLPIILPNLTVITPLTSPWPKNGGLNSAAKIWLAFTVVPYYSDFICKLAFRWIVPQLGLPLPVFQKNPASDWSLQHSVNQRTHLGRQGTLPVCFVCLKAQTDTQKSFFISLCLTQVDHFCPYFAKSPMLTLKGKNH